MPVESVKSKKKIVQYKYYDIYSSNLTKNKL